MNSIVRHALAVAGLAIATQAAAQVTFYEHPGFRGQSFTTEQQIGNLERVGFNNLASSIVVRGEPWEVCDGPGFSGRCVVLRPGEYASLGATGLNDSISSVRAVNRDARIDPPAPIAAQVTFYEGEGFHGRSFTTEQQIGNLERFGFNDRASSVVVLGDPWEVCDDIRFSGRCVILRPGRYPSLAAMGLNNRVTSVRAVSGSARIDPPAPIAAQVIFYEGEEFQGRSFTTEQQIGNLERFGFNNRASSVVVLGDPWEVCDDIRFSGRCVILRPGRYPSLQAMGLNNRVTSVRTVSGSARIDPPAPVAAQITFFETEDFGGRSFTTERQIGNFERFGFNDRASSVEVLGALWEVCEGVAFSGRCVVLRPGRYPSLAAMGMNNRISSVRAFDDRRATPAPAAVYDYRRRYDERLYEANVTSVRAVVGTPEQRCWVEREQISQDRRSANVPGAVAGAVIGGIIGHQVGSGRRQDLATAGGAVAGALVGANVGRGGQQAQVQDIQRCENVPSQARPDHWDVTYNFRGQEHRVQMTAAPGPTVTVNERGEPRE